jgi:GAF domain-containing protein
LAVGGHSLIGGATSDGRPRIVQDVTDNAEWRPNPLLPNTRSELALPMRVRGKISGALTVQSTEPNEFVPELVAILQSMADQLAIAIENTNLLSQVQARANRQHVLNEVSTQLHRSGDMNTIIGIGLQALSDHFDGAKVKLRLGQQTNKKNGAS